MKLCGFIACPVDACDEVKEIADYISSLEGGHGVVRDVIKKLLVVNLSAYLNLNLYLNLFFDVLQHLVRLT